MSSPTRPAGEVTIVAHDIGSVGGMERVLAELIVGLRAHGHPVTVIARTCELPRGTEVSFHRVPGPARPVLLAYPWFMFVGSLMVWRLRRGIVQATGAIVANRVDVIAVHYCHKVGPVTPSRATLAFRLHAKLAGALMGIAERVCFAANRSAAFVGVSEGVADELREHYPHLRERVQSIHNDRLLAAFVGSEWERKGLEPLIRALATAPAWDLAVAGGGDRARYQALADSLGVGARVHLLGVLSDVQLAYALADAFVLPSSYETFSLVTFEAAASGLPLLASPVSGVRELIRDGENGFLIGREPHDIAARLNQLGADAALRERLGAGARESALAYSWESMVQKHHQLYARLAVDARA